MSRLIYILPLLLVCLIPLDSLASNAGFSTKWPFYKKSKKKKITPQNIRNLFLYFPDEVFKIDNGASQLTLETRQQILETEDLKTARKNKLNYVLEKLDLENGYLKFRTLGNADGQEIELRYWKAKNKHQIVAVNVRHLSSCCSHSEIRFYDFFDYEFTEVTAAVFPEIPLTAFSRHAIPVISGGYLENYIPTIELPQNGKEIRVKINGSPLFDGMPSELQSQLDKMLDLPVLRLAWKGDRFRIR